MPKTYSATRKINLGKYGLQYEAIDIAVEGCESLKEATDELQAFRKEIHKAMSPLAKARIAELNQKQDLTFKEASELKELNKLDEQAEAPF